MADFLTKPAIFIRKVAARVARLEHLYRPEMECVPFVGTSGWDTDPDDEPWLVLPAGWVFPKAGQVFRDGTYLHGGDFDVKVQFGQTYIKPITPPGVNTRFDVFCRPGVRL